MDGYLIALYFVFVIAFLGYVLDRHYHEEQVRAVFKFALEVSMAQANTLDEYAHKFAAIERHLGIKIEFEDDMVKTYSHDYREAA